MAAMSKKTDMPAAVPPPALAKHANTQFFERFGKPIVERNRFFLLTLVMASAVAFMALALVLILPLKQVVPYIVEVNQHGTIAAQPIPATHLNPTHNELRFFLARWAHNLVAINPVLTKRHLVTDYKMARGEAWQQFKVWLRRYNPLGRLMSDPTLRVAAQVESVNFLGKGNAYIKMDATESSSQAGGRIKDLRYAITVTYVIVPPTTVARIYKNPEGIYITNFSITRTVM
jgi:type IV secretory pathway TrbF-like protein